MRANRGHRDNRRSHHALEAMALGACESCSKPIPRHKACPFCGKYRGRIVTNVQAIAEKRAKKAKAEAR
jgi:large subunit ribosomal protein L32